MKLTISVKVVLDELFADRSIRRGGCAEDGLGDPFGKLDEIIGASNGLELSLEVIMVFVLGFCLGPGKSATFVGVGVLENTSKLHSVPIVEEALPDG